MIIVDKNEDGVFQYYDLKKYKTYTLVHDEFEEVATEIPLQVDYKFINLLIKEIEELEKYLFKFKGDKLDYVKAKANLEFLLSYDVYKMMK